MLFIALKEAVTGSQKIESLAHDPGNKEEQQTNTKCKKKQQRDYPSQQKSALVLWFGRSNTQNRMAYSHQL